MNLSSFVTVSWNIFQLDFRSVFFFSLDKPSSQHIPLKKTHWTVDHSYFCGATILNLWYILHKICCEPGNTDADRFAWTKFWFFSKHFFIFVFCSDCFVDCEQNRTWPKIRDFIDCFLMKTIIYLFPLNWIVQQTIKNKNHGFRIREYK